MDFKLSSHSIKNLRGVNGYLVKLCTEAIKITSVDFSITEGLRTSERQIQLVREGKSQTFKSKHLKGLAIDVVAIIDRKISWENKYYFEIATAFQVASRILGLRIRWGGAWNCYDLGKSKYYPDELQKRYINLRIKQNRKYFIDAPHFELMSSKT